MNSKNFTIRRAEHADAQSIINSHIRSIREVCSKNYPPEQIEAWAGRNFRADLWCQTIDRDFVWVVEMNAEVVGFGHLAIMDDVTAELMGLYFVPEACGLGAGKRLFTLIKDEAVSKGAKKIQLHATLTAKSFYDSFGFKQVEGKCSVEMRGVDIPCFPMELEIF